MESLEIKTKVMAVRLPVDQVKELLDKAKPDESKSDLLRRVVTTFLKRRSS